MSLFLDSNLNFYVNNVSLLFHLPQQYFFCSLYQPHLRKSCQGSIRGKKVQTFLVNVFSLSDFCPSEVHVESGSLRKRFKYEVIGT